MNDKANSERWPPDNSDNVFYWWVNETVSSKPSSIDLPSNLPNLAYALASKLLNIYEKCLLTSKKHFSKVNFFFSSSSNILSHNITLSFSSIFFFSSNYLNSFSTYSVIASTLKLTFLDNFD